VREESELAFQLHSSASCPGSLVNLQINQMHCALVHNYVVSV